MTMAGLHSTTNVPAVLGRQKWVTRVVENDDSTTALVQDHRSSMAQATSVSTRMLEMLGLSTASQISSREARQVAAPMQGRPNCCCHTLNQGPNRGSGESREREGWRGRARDVLPQRELSGLAPVEALARGVTSRKSLAEAVW